MTSAQGDLIEVYRCGHKFKASRRTVAHLDWTVKRLKRRWPHARLTIVQTCYHTGVAASAGTHDFDSCFDFIITGLTWQRMQTFLRNAGWAAWWRHTGEWAAKGAWHVHAVSIPPGMVRKDTAEDVGRSFGRLRIKVGEFIDGGWTTKGSVAASSQVVDYLSVPPLDGLAGHAVDKTWHPRVIAKTIYHYNPKDLVA